jgi:primosomal protein N' (replication factor Y)
LSADTGEAVIYVETLLNVPVDKTFFYAARPCKNSTEKPLAGKRASVLFRNRKMTAFITAVYEELPPLDFPKEKILFLERVIDDEPVFTSEHIELARWIADYYICSQGEALSAMIPSGRRDSRIAGFSLESGEDEFDKKTLSEEQARAVKEIALDFSSGKARLHYLYGVTGSGKTEVFLQAAEAALALGKGALYLVPEIALTFQTVAAVRRRFGEKVAVLHSGLTPSQRIREWRRCLKKEARIAVGARSAVFAPIPDLALIIIDEEHDASYKSGSAPRYHARQTALRIAKARGIPLVMGSATPSVEAWHLMAAGAIVKHTLTARLAGGAIPQIQIVNLSVAGTAQGALSSTLKNEIEQTLAQKRQVILFLNRRGFTHIFRCATCGFELICKNCSVPLTFHKSENRLRCHYCGWISDPPRECPECASLDVGYCGFGTEYIESEVRAKFPHARVERLDTDSVREKGSLEETLNTFKRGEIDILLGTQMVAKGLNFPRLKLVGVVLADTGLSMPDFRSAERCFALITQVAGRAGRFFPDGKVIVQSFNPDRPAVALSCASRADEFYAQELETRKMLDFPPFSRLARLVFRSANQKTAASVCARAARWFTQKRETQKKSAPAVEVLGPAECPLAKIAANYRMQILLKASRVRAVQDLLAEYTRAEKIPAEVHVEIDVDPVTLL